MHPAKAGGLAVLHAEIGEQLHADTDAEERPAARMHGVFHRLDHAGARFQLALALGEMTDAGQDDPVGLRDEIRIGGELDICALAGKARGFHQRTLCRVHIPGVIIDKRDFLHRGGLTT